MFGKGKFKIDRFVTTENGESVNIKGMELDAYLLRYGRGVNAFFFIAGGWTVQWKSESEIADFEFAPIQELKTGEASISKTEAPTVSGLPAIFGQELKTLSVEFK